MSSISAFEVSVDDEAPISVLDLHVRLSGGRDSDAPAFSWVNITQLVGGARDVHDNAVQRLIAYIPDGDRQTTGQEQDERTGPNRDNECQSCRKPTSH